MKKKMKKLFAILLAVCLMVPSIPSMAEDVAEKTIDEFISVSNSTTTHDYGNNAYNDSKVNSTMIKGAVFVFHTKVKGTLEGKNGPQITYTGWGNGQEYYYSEFRRDTEDGEWWFRLESKQPNGSWPVEIEKTYLSESQCNKIKGEGLDLFMVKTGTSSYAIYMENADLTDITLVGSWDSRQANTQVYAIQHNKAELVTKGYFYTGYTAEGVVRALYEPKVVDKTNISENVSVPGLEDAYHLGDTMAFGVVANDGYAVTEVKINDEVLTAKEDGTYEYLVTLADVDGLAVSVDVTANIISKFVNISNSTSAVDYGNNAYNDSKVNTTMSNGAVFVLHSKVKAPLTGNTQITYTGYGSGYWEKFYSEFRKDDTGWYFQVESENQYQKWYTEVTKQYLSEGQCNAITGEGLDLYLVKTGASSYAIYMENSDLTDVTLVGEWTSRAASPQIYQVKNNTVDSITTGYFYQGYSAEEVVKELYKPITVDKTNISEFVTVEGLADSYRLSDTISFGVVANEGYAVKTVKVNDTVLSAQEDGTYNYVVTFADVEGLEVSVTATVRNIGEFVTISNSTTALNFGNYTYQGGKVNTTMSNGAIFVLHTKVKAPLTGNTQVSYTGYGSGYWEKFYSEFRKDDTGWYFQVESENQYQKWYTEVTPQYLSESQCNAITGDGLDLYLVKTSTTSYAIYMDNADLTDVVLVGEWASRAASPQIYEVKNNTVDSVTTGYFCEGYTAEEIVEIISNTQIQPNVSNENNLTVMGLKESYTLGEVVEFSVTHIAGYIDAVTVNGTTVIPNAEGMYQIPLTLKHSGQFDIAFASLAPTFAFLEHKDGGKIQLAGAGTNNFGNVGNNFLFHTKIKCEDIINENKEIQYPESETIYAQIQYGGWASNTYPWNSYNIQLVLDSTSAKLKFVGDDNWNTTPITLDDDQIKKIATDGLDIYFVHSSSATTAFEMYVEQGQTEDVYGTSVKLTSSSRGNTTVYQVKHSNLYEGTTIVTTGYTYTEYATTKKAVEIFSELTAKDIALQVTTGENVTLEVASDVCHVGDYFTFVPVTEEGYVVSSLTVNGTKLSPDASGMYHLAVTLEHLDGISVEVVAGQAFEAFVTLTGAASNQHGDKLDKFIYHTKVQGDLLLTGEEYINITYYTWGDGVGDSVCVRVNVTDSDTATLLLGKYYSGSDGGWAQKTYTLDAKQVKKMKGSGLNLYLVHEGADSKTFDLYVEDADSQSVTKVASIDAYHGDHVYKVSQTKKDGASVTTTGYQYADFLSSTTAPTELFWEDTNANTGDTNDDGVIDVRDLVRAKKYVGQVTVASINVRAGDMNKSRTLTVEDINDLRKVITEHITTGTQLDHYNNLNVQSNTSNPTVNSNLFYNNTRSSSTIYGADPAVMEITDSGDKNIGKYIMVVTGNSNNQTIPVYMGSDLVNWKSAGNITIVNENGESAAEVATADLWAMEMIYDETEDKYYLFFSATPTTPNSAISEVPYVAVGNSYSGNFKLINHSDYKYADNTALTSKTGTDALGYASYLKYSTFDPYKMGQALVRVGLVSNPAVTAFKAIDTHPFVDVNGDKYLYFSITSVANKQVILGIKMTNWFTPQYDTLTVLTEVKRDQVNNGSTVSYERSYTNEGPWMTVHNGTYYLTFSINSYKADNYKVIQAVANSPLGTFRKLTTEEGGVLLGADRIGEISGPGHHSIIEREGEFYIVYHVHDDPADPSYQRHVVMDKVEWVTNANGLEVMYVNGPTLSSIQALPGFASGYKNVAPLATVNATNLKAGNEIGWLTDKLWNSKASTWMSNGSGTNTFFGDIIAKDTEFSDKTTITMTFTEATTVRALMIYNSSSLEKAFDEIERIELVCADGSVKYINHLGFDFTSNTYTLSAYQGVTTGTDKFICGASVADFNELNVTEIRIIVKPAEGKTSVALGEIVVLGKN